MTRMELEQLVAQGLTIEEIAVRAGVTRWTIRRRLREHGLWTGASSPRSARFAERGAVLERQVRNCGVHGATMFARRSDGAGWRCLKCRSEAVARRRRKVKEILVAEAGGRCALCGYDRCVGALHFHHRDPGEKRFAMIEAGVARSLARERAEAAKCVLLCGNCHIEVEAGVAALPVDFGSSAFGTGVAAIP